MMVQCPECGKEFTAKANLNLHLHTHSHQRNYECDVCGKRYKTHSILWKHKKIHEGVKYKCPLCPTALIQLHNLKVHIRLKHEEVDVRNHICHICCKKFKTLCNLKVHVSIHDTNRLRHECSHCNLSYMNKSSLYRHIRSKHSQKH